MAVCFADEIRLAGLVTWTEGWAAKLGRADFFSGRKVTLGALVLRGDRGITGGTISECLGGDLELAGFSFCERA